MLGGSHSYLGTGGLGEPLSTKIQWAWLESPGDVEEPFLGFNTVFSSRELEMLVTLEEGPGEGEQ